MAKVIRFIELELINFTSHRNLSINYGDITKLSGQNGEGKTSIGTAPIWILYGTDLWSKTFNPSPSNYEFDRVFASIILSVDGVEMKFAREIDEKGKNVYHVNDIPNVPAREFEAKIAEHFDKDEFLSLYNPSYFFTLHWTKQREQIMKRTTAPAKQEVLKHLPEPQSKKLDELTKKHSLDDLQKLHRDQKNKLEKAHIAAESRTKTLQEQFSRADIESVDVDATKVQIEKIDAEIREIEKITENAGENNRKINELNVQIKSLLEQRDRMKQQAKEINDEPIRETCSTCGQQLDEESIKKVEKSKRERIERMKPEFDGINTRRKELEKELITLEHIDVTEQLEKIRELEAQRSPLAESIRDTNIQQSLKEQIETAKQAETDTLTSLRESIFILDAIKAYRAKEAELQAEKVQSLFTTLSIRLFKYVKSTGEYEPDFSVQMDGKDYQQLSFGEKMTAGLELSEVLFKQSELITPTFLDAMGEYTGDIKVYGQVITAGAVKGQKLKIETEDAT